MDAAVCLGSIAAGVAEDDLIWAVSAVVYSVIQEFLSIVEGSQARFALAVLWPASHPVGPWLKSFGQASKASALIDGIHFGSEPSRGCCASDWPIARKHSLPLTPG